MYRVSLPIHIFKNLTFAISQNQSLIHYVNEDIKNTKDDLRLQSLKINRSKLYKKIKYQKANIAAYWDYIQLRAINEQEAIFNNRTFIASAAEFLGLSKNEVRKKKRNIIKYGFAYISGKKFVFNSKDTVWATYGLNIAKRRYKGGKRVAHKKFGVYEVLGVKKKSFTVRWTCKRTNKPKCKTIKKEYEKKKEIKVLKFTVTKEQLRSKTELKTQTALAIYKHTVDRETSRQQDELRKTEDLINVDLTCNYIARAVGYISSGSGWKIRKSLEDCGFITIKENKTLVKDNVGYEKAMEDFPLQQGIQENGWAYMYNKLERCVYAVKCFSVFVNGYSPIIYPKKPKKSKKPFVPAYEAELQKLNNTPIKKIWQECEHLFWAGCGDYLFELFDSGERFFYENWQKYNLKKRSDGIQTTFTA